MPALLFPLGLAALLAVVVPLVIHLMRRDELRPVVFAALRWLDPKPKPRQRIRFSEWPLLLARLLLIAVLAVLLARPVLSVPMDRTPFIAVMPGLDPGAVQGGDDEVRLHWLAPGFPSTDVPSPKGPVAVASLLRELDAQLPPGVKLSVVTPEILQGIDAERPVLSRPVEWRVVPGAMPAPQGVDVTPPALSVRDAADQADGVHYLRAAAAAWQTPFDASGTEAALPDKALPDKERVLVWLSAGELPQAVRDWAASGGTVLSGTQGILPASSSRTALWRDATGAVVAEGQAHGRGRLLRLTRGLIPAQLPLLIESEFPEKLNYLLSRKAVEPSRVAAQDIRPATGARTFERAATKLTPWLALIAAVLFLIERLLATDSRRRAAP